MKFASNKKIFSLLLAGMIALLWLVFFSPIKIKKDVALRAFVELATGGNAYQHYRKSVYYFNNQKIEMSIWELRVALFLDPEKGETYRNLGTALYIKGDKDEGIKYLESALEIDPGDEVTRRNLAGAYEETGIICYKNMEYSDALRTYLKLAELRPNDPFSRIRLGSVYLKMGSPTFAKAEFQNALRVDPDNPKLYRVIGFFYDGGRLYDEAIDVLKRGIELKPDDTALHFNLGAAYSNKGWTQKALEEMRKVLEIDPGDERALKGVKTLESGRKVAVLNNVAVGKSRKGSLVIVGDAALEYASYFFLLPVKWAPALDEQTIELTHKTGFWMGARPGTTAKIRIIPHRKNDGENMSDYVSAVMANAEEKFGAHSGDIQKYFKFKPDINYCYEAYFFNDCPKGTYALELFIDLPEHIITFLLEGRGPNKTCITSYFNEFEKVMTSFRWLMGLSNEETGKLFQEV